MKKIIQLLKIEVLKDERFSVLKCFYFLLFNPKRKAIFFYRLAKYFYDANRRLLSLIFENKLVNNFGCYISLKAQIGINFELKHPNGVVIGEGVTIGDNVTIYQQVTLGGKNVGDSKKNHYPTIKNRVTIFAGAKIIGNIGVGENAIIGANSVVISDVEPNSVYAGIPARKVSDI